MKTMQTKIIITVLFDEAQRRQHGNYRYLVESAQSKSGFHYNCKAFHTKKGLKRWMRERGLKVGERMCWGKSFNVVGTYYDNMMLDVEAFNVLEGDFCYCLSNGDYTAGKITEHAGYKVINYLNPNCKREKYDYKTIRELVA